MEKVKILELMVWTKNHNRSLKMADMYKMVGAGLIREKHESFLCITNGALYDLYYGKCASDEIKRIANEWMLALQEFKDDKDYHQEKEYQERELVKIEEMFEKIEKDKHEIEHPNILHTVLLTAAATFLITISGVNYLHNTSDDSFEAEIIKFRLDKNTTCTALDDNQTQEEVFK